MPKGAGKQAVKKDKTASKKPAGKIAKKQKREPVKKDKTASKKPAGKIAKKQKREPQDAQLAAHAGRMMQMSNTMGHGSYAGAAEAMKHHAGKTLATSMGSKKQSDFSASVAKISSGALGASFAKTGVFQVLAVHAHKGKL